MTPLLTQYPVLATSNPEEMEAALRSAFGAGGFDLKSPPATYKAMANLWHLGEGAGLGYVECDGEVDISLPATDAVRLYVGFDGHITQRTPAWEHVVGAGGIGLIGPSSRSVTTYHHGSRLLVLRFEQARLRAAFRALTGRHVAGNIEFADRSAMTDPHSRETLRSLVNLLAMQADRPPLPASKLLEEALVQTLATALLTTLQHNWSDALEAPAPTLGRTRIRQAEEFIAAHWNEPLTAQQIAAHLSCSERTLFKSFQAAHGFGPNIYLRKVRLEQARRLLSQDDPRISVADVATRCGFGNLGHFARYYRREFGLLPSETKRRRA
jgi:AraC-like DNA-binding protein